MKKISILLAIFASAVIIFTGCKKDDRTPVLDIKATVNPAWLVAPTPDTHFQLIKDSADMVLTTLEWSDVVYSLSGLPSPLYTLQLFMADSTVADQAYWGEAIELFTFPETTRTVTYGELNTAIVKVIGTKFAEDTVITAGFRIKANVNANDVSHVIDAFSEIASFTVTPYSSEISAAAMWVPGAYQGWSPAAAPQIWDTDGDGVFEGYVFFPESATFDGNFKFTAFPDWVDGGNYGSDGTEFGLDNDSGAGNLLIPAPGGYWLTCDINNMVWSYEAQSFGVIGSGILNGDWSEDVNLVATAAPFNVVEVTIDVTESQDSGALRFKFRLNDGWDINYGADEGSNVLIEHGSDILMPDGAGNYTFKMDLSKPVFTYELIKN